MIKRIVVPLDGSEEAEQAIPVATDFAEAYGAELLLLRVFELPPESGGYDELWELVARMLRENIKAEDPPRY